MKVTTIVIRTMIAVIALTELASFAKAQNQITCTGILIDVDLSERESWPLAVIRDTKGGYVCTIDRIGSGHDPLRPCNEGETCRVVGTARKIGNTFQIKTLTSVENIQQ